MPITTASLSSSSGGGALKETRVWRQITSGLLQQLGIATDLVRRGPSGRYGTVTIRAVRYPACVDA